MTHPEEKPRNAPVTPLVAVTDDPSNPLAKNDEGYWFWNEVWCDAYGPFETLELAQAELKRYAHWLHTGELLPAA